MTKKQDLVLGYLFCNMEENFLNIMNLLQNALLFVFVSVPKHNHLVSVRAVLNIIGLCAALKHL